MGACSRSRLPSAAHEATEACTPGETRCDDAASEQSCGSDARWNAPRACVEQTCIASLETCSGDCAPGQARCGVDNAREICSPDTGIFVLDSVCAGGCLGDGNCIECDPDVDTRCEDTATMNSCTPEGMWGDLTDCAATDTTCAGSAETCTGDCAHDARRCADGDNAYDICGADGSWGTRVECAVNGNRAWEVCRDGECVDSPFQTMGQDNADSWEDSLTKAAGRWRMGSIVVDHDIRLFSLHAHLTQIPDDDTTIQLGIWDDQDGQPRTLVAYTDVRLPVLGDNALLVLGSDKSLLTEGSTYWIGIHSSGTNPTGISVAWRSADADILIYNEAFGSPADISVTLLPTRGEDDVALYLRGKPEY